MRIPKIRKLSQKNVFSVITIFLIFIFIISALIFSVNNEKKESSTNPSEIVFPADNNKKQDNHENFKFAAYNIRLNIEKFFINWKDILGIVSFNKAQLLKDSNITGNQVESMTSKIIPDNFIISTGNVNELVSNYGDLIKEQCTHYKLDWRLILAMIRQESYFNSDAVSRAGAYGLMQIMPKTGFGLQNELKLEDTKTPANNLTAGIYYYASLVTAFEFTKEEKYKFALAAYNAGLSRVIDVMSITNYFGKDYNKWDVVKEYFPYLASSHDSLHKLIWKSGHPTGGTLNNWMEPYKYVEYITFYFDYFKNVYKSNLEEPVSIKKKKKKK